MIVIFLGRLGQIILTLLAAKLATTFLSAEEFGKVSQFLACIAWFALVMINPVGMFINRKLYNWVLQGKATVYFLYYFGYLLLAGFTVALFFMLVAKLGLSVIHGVNVSWLIMIVGGSIIFNTVNQTFIPTFNLFGHRNWFVGLTLASLAVSLILSVGLVYGGDPKAEYWQFGQVLGQTLVGLVGALVFFTIIHCGKLSKNAAARLSKEKVRSLLSFSIPVAVAVGLLWLQTQSYRFIAGERIGLGALGLFFAGYSVSSAIIASFEAIILNYFQPFFYRSISTNSAQHYDEIWSQYARVVFPPLLLTVIFIFLFSPEITRVLLSKNFSSSYRYVYWGALAEAGRVVISTYGLLAHARLNTKKLMLPNFIGAIVSLALIFVLTPKYKADGIGVALVLASLAAIIVIHHRVLKKNIVLLLGRYLIKAFICGIFLIIITRLTKNFFPATENIMAICVRVSSVGVIYLLLMYYLLRDFVEDRMGSKSL